jgi:redox-sensitive bicupin YhaK (pirin superfamily)
VTYLFEGEEVHRDSMGNVETIRPAELNVMTAGRGVVHSERSDAAWRARGGTLHGLQLWLALPVANEDDEPSFAHHEGDDLPWVERPGARAHILFGATSKAFHPTRPHLIDVTLDEGASFEIARPGEESAVYVVEGEVAAAGRVFGPKRLLVAAPDATIAMVARRPSRLVVLGGPPLDGKRLIDWNFVSSSRERIEAARAAWLAREFPRIPGDDVEFVPLPG